MLLAAIEDSGLVRKGWGSDRRVARQVSTLQATTPNSPELGKSSASSAGSRLAVLGFPWNPFQNEVAAALVALDGTMLRPRSRP